MLATVGLLLQLFPVNQNLQLGLRVETRRSESLRAESVVTHPLLASGSRVLDEQQISRQFVSTWQSSATPAPAFQSHSTGHHVAGAIIGAAAGFFAGGYLGANFEPDCSCDDPGLKGFLIGAPIGAVAGGILGARLF